MCTLNDDISEAEEAIEDIIPVIDTAHVSDSNPICKKCGCQETYISLRSKNNYCKTCFLTMTTHKFKAALGKSKLMKLNDWVLIGHSGKVNSTVLLHLATRESMSKKLSLKYKVLHIDDGMIKGQSLEERQQIRNALTKEAETLPFPVYTISLSKSIAHIIYDKIHLIDTSEINVTEEDEALRKIFKDLQNDTARDELLKQLRQKLLVSAAYTLECSKIFVADTSVDIAIKVLGDVSTGRGSQLPFNVAFSDTRYSDLMLLRPLRDFTEEDIAGYAHFYELHPILSSRESKSPFRASIRSIAKRFVQKLDSECYGTVSTIYRISGKISAKIEELNDGNANGMIDDNKCVLCELTLDSSPEEVSVVQAKLFSKLVSTVKDFSVNSSTNSLCTFEQTVNEQIKEQKGSQCRCTINCNSPKNEFDVGKYLCYSCKLIFLDSKQANSLPGFILDSIKRRAQIENLREKIAGFLL
ncbi:cytoplasmic tRNA 2-thiolation protein 2 [Ceratina calcarata]|uniref:Cytoplasmic tRNA 2-thiolation protein 2 n=1 Tax=Ceratina calcarata TaxID=156304 RepID=A0AAJ7IXF1_9HYME|nr:cytoplasmic tRNA 2-thiolation protein 2 [Ceratina calcarata]